MAKTSQQPQIPIPIDDLLKGALGSKGYRSSLGTLRRLLDKLTRSEVVIHGGPSGIKGKLKPNQGSNMAKDKPKVFGVRGSNPDAMKEADQYTKVQEFSDRETSIYMARAKKKNLEKLETEMKLLGGVWSEKPLKIISETRTDGKWSDALETKKLKALARAGGKVTVRHVPGYLRNKKPR